MEPPDLSERGGMKGGEPQRSNNRLYMQLVAFGGCRSSDDVATYLSEAGVTGVLYEDLSDPRGIGVLTLARSPDEFLDSVRPLFNAGPFANLLLKSELTMFGRTYALGYEPDLEDTLIGRPRRTVLHPDWRWGLWYPLRRSGKFALLSAEEQRTILAEHGALGISYGAADYAHDVRLACYGIDRDDNDFVIGLIGKELFPLSALVQAMRNTQQTSLYLERLGPFFIGRARWKSAAD